MSTVVRDGLYWGRTEEREDHPSDESPRPWRKRMATLLLLLLEFVVDLAVNFVVGEGSLSLLLDSNVA